jgi:pilus assembly protein Flp/PilA
MATLIRMLKDQSGASAAEYALILAIIGATIAIAAITLGGSIGNAMQRSGNCINAGSTATSTICG